MLLELKNIKKYFPVKGGFFGTTGDHVKAVDGVDLTIRPGENISLVGESGCGKTTLARIILKLIRADAGSIVFDGQDITHLANRHMAPSRKNMQMVFQDPFASWGNMLSDAMSIIRIRFAPWILFPAFFIFLTVICFNVIGNALRDCLDPMLNGES